MRTFALIAAATLLAAPAFASEAASSPKDVFGLWTVRGGTALIQITDCGDGTPCGKLVHVVAPNPKALLDDQNPDPELATQPLIGSKMLWGFKEKSDKWSSGKIYDAESGKSYKSKLERKDAGTLEVKGCVGPICQKQFWTEVKLD
jgi:uncharacterized protein (DUF2147 family)